MVTQKLDEAVYATETHRAWFRGICRLFLTEGPVVMLSILEEENKHFLQVIPF
jgi:hypothetical protein